MKAYIEETIRLEDKIKNLSKATGEEIERIKSAVKLIAEIKLPEQYFHSILLRSRRDFFKYMTKAKQERIDKEFEKKFQETLRRKRG